MDKPNITIGIPAYNEEQNIGRLLNSILSQNTNSGEIIEIIIISDGSTDNTVKVIKSFSDKRIKLIEKLSREGAYQAQNQMVKIADSDILIILNADILPANNQFVDEIIKPIISNPLVALTTPATIPAKPRTFFEKIIAHSHILKQSWYKDIRGGNNLYMCSGIARAFSKDFYKRIEWPRNVPEDAYSYLACIKLGYKFEFSANARIIFHTPSNLTDHLKQSTRFFGGRNEMKKMFPEIDHEYYIPITIKIRRTFQLLLKSPILTISYAVLGGLIWIFGSKKYQAKWKISDSTKRAITETDDLAKI